MTHKFEPTWSKSRLLGYINEYKDARKIYADPELSADKNPFERRKVLCYASAANNMWACHNNGKDVILYLGTPTGLGDLVHHAWVECDGKEYHTNRALKNRNEYYPLTVLDAFKITKNMTTDEILKLFNTELSESLTESKKEDYKLVNIDDDFIDYNNVSFWENTKNGTTNAIIDFDNKKSRLRASMIIVKDGNKILLGEEADEPGVFSLPGGGIEPGETAVEAAKRECEEEVKITAKNIRETGHNYCECHDELKDWVKENVPEEYQWYNYYTCLCIGEYDEEYTGKIDKVDLDPNMDNSSKFYLIKDVLNDPSFKLQWKKALYDAGYIKRKKIDENFAEKKVLLEDTRTQQVNASRNVGQYKNKSKGKNRFERKKYSKVATVVKQYNTIDMNKFFKDDLLEIDVPVTGETNNYKVSIRLKGVCTEIARNIKANQNKFEYRTVVQSLTKIFNTTDVYTKCTCDDYCLHEDTKIKLLNGETITVRELEKQVKTAANPIYLYSVDDNGDFKPGKIKDVWVSGWVDHMIKITLDNGKEIVTTEDHPFMLRDGTYKPAADLQLGQSLMPLYFGKTTNGYETVKANSVANTVLNHKVAKIEYIKYDSLQPVYDIEVEGYHNFYVEAGIILHNCYRFAHWNIVHNVSVDDTAHDPGPGKGITNPGDDKGRGCKHILLVLANGDWMMKVASCISNYIHWMEENKTQLFMKVIFPKLYGVSADEAEDAKLVPEDTNLETEKHIIEVINDWAKNRGKYKAGTNKNPVTGTGGRQKQQDNNDEESEQDKK